MIVADKNFRANPARAVYVQGTIDQQLIHRLTPQILRLQSLNRDPITVYIDSPGGAISQMENLWRLLTASNQDSARACNIITVVTSRAASAAADLLSSGDYAIALPHSTVLYHGSRTFRDMEITLETTSLLAQFLRMTNETYAMELVRKIESRFMFRFLLLKNRFNEVRGPRRRRLSDTECFLALISDSLSDRAKKVFKLARERHNRYEGLLTKAKRKKVYKRVAKTEAARIKAIVDFELESNKGDKNWTFRNAGLTQLTDDFFLLNEYLESSQSDRLVRLCSQWGRFALNPQDQAEIDGLPEDRRAARLVEKVRPLLEPLWAFFVALCHALQEGENELTATDAFWLGLIDEVMGDSALPSFRLVAEYTADPVPGLPPAEQPPEPPVGNPNA